jgi:molybdate transport system permease protein
MTSASAIAEGVGAGVQWLWSPLLLSLAIATCATLVVCLTAIPLAFLMARRRFAGKTFLEALIIVPLVLPPTVVGYLIIVVLGANGWVGQYFKRWLDYSIMFRFEGAVLAASVVALPMLYMPAKAAFAGVDRELEDIATLFGASRLQMFWHVSLPLARRGILSGALLAFARAIGEFGATLMVFGWMEDRVTLPIAVYLAHEQPERQHEAAAAVAMLMLLSLGLILAYNQSSAGKRD